MVIEHRYRPRGTAAAIFADRRDEILISGPAGTGKSRAALEKVNACMVKYPNAKALLLRQTAVSLAGAALATWQQHVVSYLLADQGGSGELDYYGGSGQEPPQYRYANGSRVMFGGLDNPTKIMSTEYDLIYVQEATELTPTAWDYATTRLRNGVMPYQQIIADCNPDAPTHWLKQRCDEGTCALYNSTHEENPRLFDEHGRVTVPGAAYIKRLDALTGVRYHRLRKGLWVAAEGVIYGDWLPAVHEVEPFKIPDHWPRYWAVDFGFTNPFVLQCWARDDDGRLYLYRELYHTERLVEDHARDILLQVTEPTEREQRNLGRPITALDIQDDVQAGRRRWTEPKPTAVVCDHDAEGRATLVRHLGIGSTAAAVKNVGEGIQRVQARVRVAGDGKPRLFIVKGCTVERDQSLV